MKLIAFRRLPDRPITIPPTVDLIADSAIVTAGRPLFLPDFTDKWEARLWFAVRIGRLGKDVAPKFAMRYIDAYTLAVRLRPIFSAAVEGGVDGLFDNCVALGEWQPVADGRIPDLTVAFEQLSCRLDACQTGAAEALAVVSKYATVKTGDIILPCQLPDAIAVNPGRDIKATILIDGTDDTDKTSTDKTTTGPIPILTTRIR